MATKKSNNKKNTYVKKARKKGILEQMNEGLDTKGDFKNTMLETGKVLLIGVVGGGLIGAIIGKPSFLAGLATSGIGHYTGNRVLSLMGVGMMASNGFGSKGVNGFDGLDGIKERVMAFKEDLMDKTYLNKLRKVAGGGATTEPKTVGELQYFNYANDVGGHSAALASIEDQLLESGMQFHGANSGSFAAPEEEFGFAEESLY